MALVIILGIAVALFMLAFVTKRRFGVLGLGVAAGVVLSQLWATTLANLLEAQHVTGGSLSYVTVAQLLCMLVPPLLLMIGGPKYHDAKGAIFGSVLFAGFATLFIIAPITHDFEIAGDTSPVLTFIATWQNVLIGAGVLLAIWDILLAHRPRFPKHGKEKH